MTKYEAINELLNCQWLDRACNNIGGDMAEDLKQDFWIKVLTLDEYRFEPIKHLQFFCVRMLINMVRDNRDKFGRYEMVSISNIEHCQHSDYDNTLDRICLLKESILGRLPLYDRTLYKMHESGMSYKKIHRETKIHHKEVGKTINNVKSILKDAAKHI